LNLLPTVPEDYFAEDDDGNVQNESYLPFYEAVYTKVAPYLQTVEKKFNVVDMDCEPVEMLPGVTAQFPASVERYPQTWHKYPCFIESDALFQIVGVRILRAIDGKPHFRVSDCRNIGTIH